MNDHRTPRYDGSDQYSKKAATSDKPTLTSNPRARAGFTALFGDATVGADGVVAMPAFFGQLQICDLEGTNETYMTGRAVSLEEVA